MTETAFSATLARIESKVDQLIEDVNAPPRHGEPGGLLVRHTQIEQLVAGLRHKLDAIETRLAAIEAQPGKTAITWADRLGLGLLGLLFSAIGVVVGSVLRGPGT